MLHTEDINENSIYFFFATMTRMFELTIGLITTPETSDCTTCPKYVPQNKTLVLKDQITLFWG